jgi:uncharacterized hydrophobic protein (TIGR00271 family)
MPNIFERLFKRVKKKVEERSTYSELKETSKADKQYYYMLAFSTIIATFGLFLDSVAVIIGGMLIAPLMSPVLAVGLGVARGDLLFLRSLIKGILFGSVLGVFISSVIAFALPDISLGNQVYIRIEPNLFDLVVAFFSGVAGAYAYAHKDVNAALPGVAIAAALIPPLSVVGIGVGYADYQIMLGALLLFTANLIAISFGGAITFLLVGFYPSLKVDEGEVRNKAFIVSIILIVIVLIPMSYFTITNIKSARNIQKSRDVVLEYYKEDDKFTPGSIDITKRGDEFEVIVQLYGVEEPGEQDIKIVKDRLKMSLGEDVKLIIRYIKHKDFIE